MNEFSSAFQSLEVNESGGLTKRAADKWDAPRFLSIFLALSFCRFDGESTLRPLAANAHRWLASQKYGDKELNKYPVVLLFTLFSVLLSGCQTNSETVELPATKAPTATTMPAVTLEPSPTATEKVMTLEEKVDAFRSEKIDFPTDMTPEQYSAFIDGLNNRMGSQPIWVDVINKQMKDTVWYYDVPTNHMVQIDGTYAENKAIVDTNSITNTYIELYTDSLGNLQFIHPYTGELVTVPNSANMDWNLIIDSTNYKSGVIDLPTTGVSLLGTDVQEYFDSIIGGKSPNPDNNELKVNLVPAILMDNTPLILTRDEGGGQGYGDGLWVEHYALEMLFIRTNANNRPLYAIKVFVQDQAQMKYVQEDGSFNLDGSTLDPRLGNNREEIEEFESGAIYYVALTPNQKIIWDVGNRDEIDRLENVTSETDAYNAAVIDSTPDEQVILTSQFMIKKK